MIRVGGFSDLGAIIFTCFWHMFSYFISCVECVYAGCDIARLQRSTHMGCQVGSDSYANA